MAATLFTLPAGPSRWARLGERVGSSLGEGANKGFVGQRRLLNLTSMLSDPLTADPSAIELPAGTAQPFGRTVAQLGAQASTPAPPGNARRRQILEMLGSDPGMLADDQFFANVMQQLLPPEDPEIVRLAEMSGFQRGTPEFEQAIGQASGLIPEDPEVLSLIERAQSERAAGNTRAAELLERQAEGIAGKTLEQIYAEARAAAAGARAGNPPAGPATFRTLTAEEAQEMGFPPGSVVQVNNRTGEVVDRHVPSTGSTTQRDAEIANLMAQTNPETGQPFSSTEAANIVDGIVEYEQTQDGRVLRIDNRDGTVQEIRQLGPGETADGVAGGASAAGGTIIPPGLDITGATGGEGVVTNTVNAITDAIGAGAAFPNNQQTTQALNNLRVRTITQMAANVPGRDSNQIREMMDSLTVAPNDLATGPSRAADRFRQTRDMIARDVSDMEGLLNRPGLTPAQASQMRQNLENSRGLLADYDAILNQMSGGSSAAPAPAAGTVDPALLEYMTPEERALFE